MWKCIIVKLFNYGTMDHLKRYDNKYKNSLMMARVVSKHAAILVACEEYI